MADNKEPIRNKELAKLMKQYCDEYSGYEYQDFLKIFAEVIEQLVAQGETIRILNLGDFKPRFNPGKDIKIGNKQYTTEDSNTMMFTVSRCVQERLKKGYRQESNKVAND